MASVRKDPRGSGAWQVRYRKPNGKMTTKGGFKRKNDALRWARTAEVDKDRGDWIDPTKQKVRFGDFAEQWLAGQEHLSPQAQVDYALIIRNRLVPALGGTALGQVTTERLQDLVAAQGEQHAAGTVRKTVAVLRRVLGGAVQRGYLRSNPCDGVSLPRTEDREMLFLSAEEIEALAQAMPARYGTLVRFAAWTGLRAGECGALRLSDFTDGYASVRVMRSVGDVNGKLTEGKTKNRRNRVVGVPELLRDDLRAHVAARYPHGATSDELVFPGERGGWLRHTNFYRLHFRPAVKNGLPAEKAALRFHDLRHTAAALLIGLGAHPLEVKERLGHSSINVTMDVYGHIFPARHEALTAELDAHLRAARNGGS